MNAESWTYWEAITLDTSQLFFLWLENNVYGDGLHLGYIPHVSAQLLHVTNNCTDSSVSVVTTFGQCNRLPGFWSRKSTRESTWPWILLFGQQKHEKWRVQTKISQSLPQTLREWGHNTEGFQTFKTTSTFLMSALWFQIFLNFKFLIVQWKLFWGWSKRWHVHAKHRRYGSRVWMDWRFVGTNGAILRKISKVEEGSRW